jgi:hypothetical protein
MARTPSAARRYDRRMGLGRGRMGSMGEPGRRGRSRGAGYEEARGWKGSSGWDPQA